MRVGILGGGRWGQALARLVIAAGHKPFIAWADIKPPHVLPNSRNPPEVAAACELLLVATSADEVRRAIRLTRPGPRNRVVVAGRGIDPTTGAWLTDVVLQESDCLRVGALAGPSPVDEILSGGLCAGVVASRYDEVRSLLLTALHSSRYRVYESVDLTGVQLSGAMMPVVAALHGLTTSLPGAGIGMEALVLSRGVAETIRLGTALGADSTTFVGLAGMGDLVASQARPGHPHYEAGVALAKGDTTETSPLKLARAVLGLARLFNVEMPLTQGLVRVAEGTAPIDVITELMQRRPSMEYR